jgi:queuine tRNA-ribosyltransferase
MESLFTLVHQSSECKARAGFLNTDHGIIETPVFMPVGTQGAVKAISHRTLDEIGSKIILGNTYHLHLRPGSEVVAEFEGLHKFINWDKAILTDSGGYQVFSLQDLRKLSENGVEFRSHIDGSKHFFSPENVIQIQRRLGSDIVMVLDECTPYPAELDFAQKSMELSLRWAKRSKLEFQNSEQLYSHRQFLFSISQGSMYPELRKIYNSAVIDIGFDGYAIGGLSVGEPAEEMYKIVALSTDVLPAEKPRYLMGVGTPENILQCIELGIDMFDCVLPTRNARNGQLFTTRGKVNLRNAKYKLSKEPIDENIDSYAGRNFSLGYIRHLFIAGEIFGLQLATNHNLAFYMWLVRTAREKIIDGTYLSWKRTFLYAFNAEN